MPIEPGRNAAEEELEVLALEGLNSGESIEADQRYWAEKRQRLIDRYQLRRKEQGQPRS